VLHHADDLVRKEQYDMDSIFRADGIYGRFNLRTIAAYLIAVLVEIPFMSTTFYTGPMVKHLGQADISWIFGLIVAAGLYYLLMRPVAGKPGQPVRTGAGAGQAVG
jgi:nucleobase:cation symporter-1, NCS1 family